MASLKELRNRIDSVKKTQKITSAMKMVAAAKLRRAQDQAEASRPYGERMGRMLSSLAAKSGGAGASPLMAGTGSDNVHLIVLMTADRGLCGGFNANLIRGARAMVRELEAAGKTVKMIAVGRRARDAFKRTLGDRLLSSHVELDKPQLDFSKASAISNELLVRFENGEFDTATMIYARFQSVISQVVTRQQLIPFASEDAAADADASAGSVSYDYEPEEGALLAELLPRNLSVQIFTGLLESAASEQGARMSAMDNATRNAGEMIDRLTLLFNRTRQAKITSELIEIVSGAEAL